MSLVALAEIGDKTQIATVALAARLPETYTEVLLGNRVRNPVFEQWPHRLRAVLFVLLGLVSLFW